MKRMRLVRKAFEAAKHDRVPPESTQFKEGDKIVFLRREHGQTVFRFGTYGKFPEPYSTSDEAFEANTEEI